MCVCWAIWWWWTGVSCDASPAAAVAPGRSCACVWAGRDHPTVPHRCGAADAPCARGGGGCCAATFVLDRVTVLVTAAAVCCCCAGHGQWLSGSSVSVLSVGMRLSSHINQQHDGARQSAQAQGCVVPPAAPLLPTPAVCAAPCCMCCVMLCGAVSW